jgi:hypothetical protein
MNRTRMLTPILLLALLVLPSRPARADGGTLRVSRRSGAYWVTAFTSPTPLRAGTVDVSVMVQDAATNRVLPDAKVMIRVSPAGAPDTGSLSAPRAGGPGGAKRYEATRRAATNKLLKSAIFELPSGGTWHVEVLIDGDRGRTEVGFDMAAADALPRWIDLGFWISLPAVPIVLFGIHELLVGRAAAKARKRGPG